jgi:tRNA pseudouridine55 synthase
MIIAVNKPKGPSSFAMVAKARKIYGVKKIGHAGTLDPLASGVLVLAVGREDTKKISEIVGKEKEYVTEITLGETSTTDDGEGERVVVSNLKPKISEIKKILKKFTGEIMQVPPIFSAIKVAGKRAYKSARAGEKIELKARPVLIKEIELLGYDYPLLKIRVVCGSGTYIRSLARDIGAELKVGAYMSGLVRTRVGEFRIEEAIEL